MSESTYAHHISCILKVLIYIDEHLDEPLELEKMARIATISPFHFHRLFHAYMGETVADYVKRLRLQRAAERLRYSDKPIIEIALDVGYESPAAFTKVFNQVMGSSPSHYRKKMQPLVLAIIKRTTATEEEKAALKPEYVHRKDETVLFVRRVGDYNETPDVAFKALIQFLQKEGISAKAYYSVALDDPSIVERSKCRFDAAASLEKPHPGKGEVGTKVLRGGRFAVFTYRGPYEELERMFENIFRIWYPSSKETLAERDAFCEHLNIIEAISDDERITKIYIPIL